MSHTTRSTHSARIAETFERPSRAPIMLSLAGAIVLAAVIACNVKGDRQTDNGAVVTKPEDTVQQQQSTSEPVSPASATPQNVSFETADSAYRQHRYQEATDMFTAYTQRRPDNPWGHYMLGLSAWKSGQLDVATSAFERSLDLDSTNVKTFLNLGRVLLDQGKPQDALARVSAAAEIDPTSAEVHRMLGRVQSAVGQPDSAIAEYRVALSLDETDVWSMNNMGLLLIQEERYDEALPALARAVQLRAGSPVFQNNLGIALERTGHFAAATEAYRAALAADSTYEKASRSLSRVSELVDDPAAPIVDLAAQAQELQREIATWQAERPVPVRAAVKPDSLTVPRP